VLEAMAGGKPIVSTAVEGVAELLGPLSERQLVAADDRAGFTRAVVGLAASEPLQIQIGARNRQRVVDHFTLDRTVAAYEQLYAGLIHRNM
jgi:glycosyltransferase involved in cell wall biosynthesis